MLVLTVFSFSQDHPLHTAVLACFLSGISLLILSRFVHRIPTVSPTPVKYSTIPLTELDQSTAEVLSSTGVDDVAKDERTLKWWLKVGVLSGVSCARIALFRYITDNIECAPTGYSVSSTMRTRRVFHPLVCMDTYRILFTLVSDSVLGRDLRPLAQPTSYSELDSTR
jgi:hypothetical protein